MSSPDLPFVRRGGEDYQSALHNRINALDRIKYLSGIDITTKSTQYIKALDLEMTVRWYKNYPADTKVDEDFCQRAAEVITAMEGKPVDFDPLKYSSEYLIHQTKLKEKQNAAQQPQSNSPNAGKAGQPV